MKMKNKIQWDSIINQIQPDINAILQIENKDVLLSKLCDVSNSLLDAMQLIKLEKAAIKYIL